MTGIKNFQLKIGATPDGAFGPETLKRAAEFYKLSKERAAHFFAQCAHESNNFRAFSENLSYSKAGLLKTFSKYFDDESAGHYAYKPVMIASRVYADRLGNGNELSEDGYKYRGRGALQLTGKANYQEFADSIDVPAIVTNPDLVATDYIFESAMFFFDKNKLWAICDKGVNDAAILELTKRINGGINGLADRQGKTYAFYSWL